MAKIASRRRLLFLADFFSPNVLFRDKDFVIGFVSRYIRIKKDGLPNAFVEILKLHGRFFYQFVDDGFSQREAVPSTGSASTFFSILSRHP